MSTTDANRLVVALGGNAITRLGEESVAQDYANLRRSLQPVARLVEGGRQVILTHGNGPQVGNQLIRVELARGSAPDLPLDVVVADLQGGLGYMIERVLRNHLLRRGLETPVCTLLTLVEVDPDDPALADPTKFVGPVFDEEEVERLREERGWVMKLDGGRGGWRRVVPSPEPRRILESSLITTLVDAGALVIVTGGGGIPVARRRSGTLEGVEAVIDKDLAAAILGREVAARELYVLTDVERVCLAFGTPEERPVDRMTPAEARRFHDEGHFPPGSMGPKVEAACRFLEGGGERALITDVFRLEAALAGETGTWVLPE